MYINLFASRHTTMTLVENGGLALMCVASVPRYPDSLGANRISSIIIPGLYNLFKSIGNYHPQNSFDVKKL
jgi:hypothetical protein